MMRCRCSDQRLQCTPRVSTFVSRRSIFIWAFAFIQCNWKAAAYTRDQFISGWVFMQNSSDVTTQCDHSHASCALGYLNMIRYRSSYMISVVFRYTIVREQTIKMTISVIKQMNCWFHWAGHLLIHKWKCFGLVVSSSLQLAQRKVLVFFVCVRVTYIYMYVCVFVCVEFWVMPIRYWNNEIYFMVFALVSNSV